MLVFIINKNNLNKIRYVDDNVSISGSHGALQSLIGKKEEQIVKWKKTKGLVVTKPASKDVLFKLAALESIRHRNLIIWLMQ